MKRIIFSLSFILLFLLFPSQAQADEGWVINNFQSDIAVQNSGVVRVVEVLDVDFNRLIKHGIYRDIPYVYESNGEKTYTEINVLSVQQNNSRAKYQTSLKDGYVEIKIGDPDRSVTGKNVYIITYTAKGVLRSYTDHDELYWNVTGNNWPVPIENAAATVTLDKEGMQKVACYEGYVGSQGSCQAKILSPQLAQFSTTSPLDEAKGMTIVAGYTKGLVPILTVQRPKTLWEKFIALPSLLLLLVVSVFGAGYMLNRWNTFGRDYWFGQNIFGAKDETGNKKPIGGHESTTVEFTSPEKLRPAEVGVLMDERADTTDVVATIIDLASRGYLTITELPKKWLFGKVDYQLAKKQKDTAGLLGYEALLLNKLFKSKDELTVSSLKQTFYNDLAAVKKELYKEVVAKKLFSDDPEKVRTNNVALGIALLVIGGVIFGFSASAEFVYGIDIGVGLVVSGLICLLMAQFMPRRTAYGRELYRRIKGYRLFINTAEKYRQQFFEKKNMFNEVLPYAIVFGITDKFARQMHEMGIEPSQTGWYNGVTPIYSGQFGSNLNSFSSSFSSAAASTPSSSGGFSSGGSSGGGFGGGGGGSW